MISYTTLIYFGNGSTIIVCAYRSRIYTTGSASGKVIFRLRGRQDTRNCRGVGEEDRKGAENTGVSACGGRGARRALVPSCGSGPESSLPSSPWVARHLLPELSTSGSRTRWTRSKPSSRRRRKLAQRKACLTPPAPSFLHEAVCLPIEGFALIRGLERR